MIKGNKHGARARARARRLALQGLYQWQMSGASAGDIIAQLCISQNTKDADTDYFDALLRESIANSKDLDAVFSPYLDRPLIQLDPIERAILLLSTCELKARPDVPYRVVSMRRWSSPRSSVRKKVTNTSMRYWTGLPRNYVVPNAHPAEVSALLFALLQRGEKNKPGQ